MANDEATLSHRRVVSIGVVLMGLAVVSYLFAVGPRLDWLALALNGLFFLTGLLITVGDPRTGRVDRTVQVYRAILLVPGLGVLAGTAYVVLVFGKSLVPLAALVAFFGAVLLGLYVQTPWDVVRDRVEAVRKSDNDDQITLFTPAAYRVLSHSLSGVFIVLVSGVALWLRVPGGVDGATLLTLVSLLAFGLLFMGAAPLTGDLRTKAWTYRALVGVPAAGFATAALAAALGGDSLRAVLLGVVGLGGLYLVAARLPTAALVAGLREARAEEGTYKAVLRHAWHAT